MTSFVDKKRTALKCLAGTGIWRSSYAPPFFYILSKVGLKLRPPHFNGFLSNFLICGIWFGSAMGLLFPIFRSLEGETVSALSGNVILQVFETATITGGLFGFFMACYYYCGAKLHKLPKWSAL